MPLMPRSPRPRMREPSVTTMASTSPAGQFHASAASSPLSSALMNSPRGLLYSVW